MQAKPMDKEERMIKEAGNALLFPIHHFIDIGLKIFEILMINMQ